MTAEEIKARIKDLDARLLRMDWERQGAHDPERSEMRKERARLAIDLRAIREAESTAAFAGAAAGTVWARTEERSGGE